MPNRPPLSPPVAVVALGDPARRDDGVGLRVMGRVRTLIGEIGCIRARRSLLVSEDGRSAPGNRRFRADSAGPAWRDDRRSGRSKSLVELPAGDVEPGRLVEWIEGGSDPRKLDSVLGSRRRVVLLDAVRLGAEAGTVHHWHLDCASGEGLTTVRHYNGRPRIGLQHLALWLEDELPPAGTDLIGIEPFDISDGGDLSAPILSRLPAICSQVGGIMVRVLEEEGW